MSKNRRSSQTNLLASLIAKRGSKCQFCGEEVRQVSSVPKQGRLKQSPHWLTYLYCGKEHKVRIATLEHVVRLADGGTYKRSNLRVCCSICNHKRNVQAIKEAASNEQVATD